MSAEKPESAKKYDVAISFLAEDVALAEALYSKLSEGFDVFFSVRRQEELAGTNGAESMRAPFLTESRLNVILFKDKWGTTPWTGVESHAIEDSAIKNQFRNVFLLVVEKSNHYPAWLPYSFMRFHLGEYSLDEAVGAIKLRIQEQGGRYQPLTPRKKAELLKAEEEYEFDKSRMNWPEGIKSSIEKVDELVREIERHCQEIASTGDVDIESEMQPRQSCIIRCEQLGMIVRWQQHYEGSQQKGELLVEEYSDRLFFTGELANRVMIRPPELTKMTIYHTSLSRTRQYGWSTTNNPEEFISSAALAEKLVMRFMDMIERSGRPLRR